MSKISPFSYQIIYLNGSTCRAQRSVEDVQLESKMLTLQSHLDEAIRDSEQQAREAGELRRLLEKKMCKEMEGLKSTYAELEKKKLHIISGNSFIFDAYL
jgi:hypothetical protein